MFLRVTNFNNKNETLIMHSKNTIKFLEKSFYVFHNIKGNAQFTFLCNPQKSMVNVGLMKIFKSTVHNESNHVPS